MRRSGVYRLNLTSHRALSEFIADHEITEQIIVDEEWRSLPLATEADRRSLVSMNPV